MQGFSFFRPGTSAALERLHEQELSHRLVVSNNASAEAQLEKVLKLAKKVDPKSIAQTATDASQRGLATW